MVWESTFVEVRPYGTSMSLGLLQLLDADCAARAEEGGRESTEEGSGGATKGGGTPKGGQYTEAEGDFDWVLCMGNFTARDEDVFVKVRRPPLLTLSLRLTLSLSLSLSLTLTLTLTLTPTLTPTLPTDHWPYPYNPVLEPQPGAPHASSPRPSSCSTSS